MISLIVAYDQNQVIGLNGKMPWHFKADLAYFRKITEHHTVFMGRKTYESILSYNQTPLKNRPHVVASSGLKDDRVTVVSDVDAWLKVPRQEEVFVIGGAEIYRQSLPYADRLYITHIDQAFEGDTFFPHWNKEDYTLISNTQEGPLTFAVYERNPQ
jgi:dihydrofolate reductase